MILTKVRIIVAPKPSLKMKAMEHDKSTELLIPIYSVRLI